MSDSVLATRTTVYDAYADINLPSILGQYGDRLRDFLTLKKFFASDYDAVQYLAYLNTLSEDDTDHEERVERLRSRFHVQQPAMRFDMNSSLATSRLADEMSGLLTTASRRFPSGGTTPASLLDIGCGSGLITGVVAERFGIPKSQAVGVDIFPPKSMPHNVSFLRMSRDNVSDATKGRQFDVAILSMVLHHSADPKKLLKEAAAVTLDGGYLLLKEHDAPEHLHEFLDAIHFFHEQVFPDKTLYLPNERNYKSLDDWLKLAESVGFQVEAISYDRYEDKPANTGNNFTVLLRKG